MKINKDKIAEIALSFVGQTEISGNLGFKSDRFESLMKRVGWNTGEAWCAYLGELVYKLAVEPDVEKWDKNQDVQLLGKAFSAGAVKTFNNFLKSKSFEFTKEPKKGDLAIYQTYRNGTPDWTGHLAIVISDLKPNKKFDTVEGNTNSSGGREGIEVAPKIRDLNFDIPHKGIKLVLLGFISQRED